MDSSMEVAFARLDEQVKGFKGPFEQLVSDQRKLTDAYHELAKDRQALVMIEADVHELKTEQEKMRIEYRAIDTARLESESARNAAELKKRNAWAFELLKTFLAFGAALLLYHFGVHPL